MFLTVIVDYYSIVNLIYTTGMTLLETQIYIITLFVLYVTVLLPLQLLDYLGSTGINFRIVI